jgi:hypothetical protein
MEYQFESILKPRLCSSAKWRIPPSWKGRCWHVVSWAFLGRDDKDSVMQGIPVEVLYHIVGVIINLREGRAFSQC